jgi:hypothetical protein
MRTGRQGLSDLHRLALPDKRSILEIMDLLFLELPYLRWSVGFEVPDIFVDPFLNESFSCFAHANDTELHSFEPFRTGACNISGMLGASPHSRSRLKNERVCSSKIWTTTSP